ncbi:MAG: hypothetical protein AB7K68_04995 [Bacteriovoracia bacterium]
MKYRKYVNTIRSGALIILALGLAACASTGNREISSVKDDSDASENRKKYDGREPAAMHGDFTWLDEVGDNFGRIAADNSNRAVASENKHQVLVKQKDWAFSFLANTNHFYVDVQGTNYKMIQTRINDGERFAFAAEGQAENPVTFSVVKTESDGRKVASESCDSEISYWNKKSKSYVTERKTIVGKPCGNLLSLLRDYVP